MKTFVFNIIMLLFGYASVVAQDFPNPWPLKAQKIYVDAVGNFYLLNKAEITKYNNIRVFVGRYSNKQQGNDIDVDVTNPLKVLIYSPSLSLVTFLDNMMGKSTTEINLNELGLGTISVVCSSNNNGFWAYNPVNFQLIRFNENMTKVSEISFLNQITGYDLHPNFMREYNNLLYVNDPEVGILVFDIFGTYFKTIPIKSLKYFVIENEQIFYSESNKLLSYHLKTFKQAEVDLPQKVTHWAVSQKNIYLLNEQGVWQLKP